MSQQKKLSDIFPVSSYDQWKSAAEAALGGIPFEKKLITKTYENIDLQPIYSQNEMAPLAQQLENLPGEYPFGRSLNRLGYKLEPWEIAQEIEMPLPEAFNKAVSHDLYRGLNSLVISINENFAINPKSSNATALDGLLIANSDDLRHAIKGIDLSAISFRMKANSLGLELAALILSYCKKNNYLANELDLTFGLSPLNQLKNTGKTKISISKLFDDAEQLIIWKKENNAKARIITINAETYLNGGSSSVEDVAFAIAEGTYIIRELIHRGLNIDDVAKSMSFEFAIGPKFFTEISKFRAARMLWAKIIKEFGGNRESQKMIIHAATSKINKTKFDPNVNLLRATTEALSAVFGGVQSINIASYDEVWGIAGETSRRIARNMQSVIMSEAHTTETIDPAGGSWYLESLTNSIANKAWDLFREIEAKGGLLEALKFGFVQDSIAKTAQSRKANIASRRDTLLGTNKYPNLHEKPVESIIEINKNDLEAFANKYDKKCENPKCQKAVKDYASVFMSDRTKSLGSAINAFNECTTIGKLIGATGAVNSDFITAQPILRFRMGAIFEELREASIVAKQKTGSSPQICLVNFGSLKEFKPRNDFSTDFFQVAGFELVNTEGCADAASALEKVKNTNYPAYVVCSTDDKYAEIVPEFAKKFKEMKPNTKLILAGYPADMVESYKAQGVDEFIHVKTNIYDFLSQLMKEIGILN